MYTMSEVGILGVVFSYVMSVPPVANYVHLLLSFPPPAFSLFSSKFRY